MEALLSLILGPLRKILGIVFAVGATILYGKYYKNRAEKAEGSQAQAEITQECQEVDHEVEKARQKVEAEDALHLRDDFSNLK